MNGTQDIKDLGILAVMKAHSRIQDRDISLYCHPDVAFSHPELHLTDTAMRHDGECSYPAQGSGQMARNSAILGQTPGRRSSLSCLINSREDLRPGYSQYVYLDNEEKCSVSDVLLDLALISASRTFNSGQSPSNPVDGDAIASCHKHRVTSRTDTDSYIWNIKEGAGMYESRVSSTGDVSNEHDLHHQINKYFWRHDTAVIS